MTAKELQELFDGMAIKRNRQEEIDSLAKNENRQLTDDEAREFEEISRQLNIMQSKVDAWKNEQPPLTAKERKAAEAIVDVVRAISNGKQIPETGLRVENNTIYLERQAETTLNADIAGIEAESVHALIEPLQKALLINKLGIVINTGIVGTRKYPTVSNVEASIEGEVTELVGKKLNFTATTAQPKRIGLSLPFSMMSLHDVNIDLIAYAMRIIDQAAAQLLNKWMFATTQISNASKGCFVDAAAAPVFALTTEAMTEENIISLETKVLDADVADDGTGAYVVSPKGMAKIKAMRDPISGEKIYVNGLLNGYPVLVSNHLKRTDDASGVYGIGFGIFSNVEVNQYGAPSLVVDALSRSKESIQEVNYNALFDVEVTRNEAFAYGTFKTVTGTGNAMSVKVVNPTSSPVNTKTVA